MKNLAYSTGVSDFPDHPHDNGALSAVVIKALWASFPEEHSEDAVAEAATPYFRNKEGDPISKRTIKYWLRGDTLPSALHLSTLVMMQPKMFIGFWFGRAVA